MILQEDVKTDLSTCSGAELTARANSLQMLYDYTKFHIGVYLTLTASYITASSVDITAIGGSKHGLLPANQYFMSIAIFSFLLAGLAGGVIVSSITQCVGGSSVEFLNTRIGPWNAKLINGLGRNWTYVEHTSFWIGLVAAIASFFVPRV
jgi:hypothetical protein